MRHLLLSFSLLVVGCSSGGGASSPAALPVVVPSAPASTPNTTPTTVPLAQRVIGGAPLSATASQLSSARKSAQAHTTAQGVTNGLPILVESSGMVAAWAGDQAVWATNAQTSADIPETSGTITPSGNLPINNPGFAPLSCLGSVSAVCIVHPMGFEFGTTSANGKPVGKQTLTIAFADGTTGTTVDDVYDGWDAMCGTGWVYQGGIPVATTTRATSDVFVDCVAGNVVFPQGGILAFNPVQDQFGQTDTIMPTITSAILISSFITNIPLPAIADGQVFGIATKDGGFAKVFFSGAAQAAPSPIVEGMSLHANANGTYPF